MPETPVLVVVEIISVQDAAGLGAYAGRAAALIGDYGGTLIGQGANPVDGEAGFAPLVIQRWTSEAASARGSPAKPISRLAKSDVPARRCG